MKQVKYIKEPDLVQKGMVASYCCCHDAFVIKTDEELSEVIDNLKDCEEEMKYMVVHIEDAYLLCGDFDTVQEQINCPRVKKLQSYINNLTK